MLSINNKILKFEDFSIYNPEKFEKELRLLENSNVFVLDNNFYTNLSDYLKNQIYQRRIIMDGHYYDDTFNPISKFFLKLYSNVKNTSMNSIIRNILGGTVTFFAAAGFHNIFGKVTHRYGYKYGYIDGQKDYSNRVLDFTYKNDSIDGRSHNSLKNFVSKTIPNGQLLPTLSQNLLGIGSGILFNTLLMSTVNIFYTNQYYDCDTENIYKCLTILNNRLNQ